MEELKEDPVGGQCLSAQSSTLQCRSSWLVEKKTEQGRTGVSPEISSLNDKDNGSDLGPSPGTATLLRLPFLTSMWEWQWQQPQRDLLKVKYVLDSRKL